MAATSVTELYNPTEDNIYVADKLGHRLVKLNFAFDPADPEADNIVFVDTITLSPEFYPYDIEYINFNTGDRNDNKLVVFDDINQSLAIFGDDGSFVCEFDLEVYVDSVLALYESFTYNILDSNTVAIYLADRNTAGVRLFHLSFDNQLTDINYLNLGDRLNVGINKVFYSALLGLWAIDYREPALYLLAPDLSRALNEISLPDFDVLSLDYPFNICELPDRIVIFEDADRQKGVISFALSQPHAKDTPRADEVERPLVYALDQNFPNPFNPNTIIQFSLAEPAYTSIVIYNLLGQHVKTLIDDFKPAGEYSIKWDGKNERDESVATGIYFYRIKSGDFIDTKKMLMLK
jgi:hypothetical protein